MKLLYLKLDKFRSIEDFEHSFNTIEPDICTPISFVGLNGSGKSNILRALNLFFNKRTNLEDFLDFDNDFFKRESPDDDDIKQELITIKLTFLNEKNKGIKFKSKICDLYVGFNGK